MKASDLQKVIRKAKALNIPFSKIEPSTRPGKKLMITILTPVGTSIVHFGDANSQTYIEGASKQKRDAYRARASKITDKHGQYTYKIPYTPNFLAFNLLW